MNEAMLLEQFDRVSEAPDAIPRLRRFILDLAVRGKLVEQDPGDAAVAQLLAAIRAERFERIDGGRHGTGPEVPDAEEQSTPFAIPSSWRWVRLGSISQIVMGQSPPGASYNKTGEGMPLINGPVEFTAGPFGLTVINQYTTSPTNVCEAGDLLLCVRGSTTGRTNIAAHRACIGRGVAAIRPLFGGRYAHLFIWQMRASIISTGRGIAFPSVSRGQIEALLLPLPPLVEQQRIVAKVDELMALCDRLEAAQAERESRRDRLVAASLHRLSEPRNDGAARETARFYVDYVPRMTTQVEHVKELRRTILELAVQGHLGRANETYKPERLGNVAKLQNGYAFKSEWFELPGTRLLRNANVGHGVMRWDDVVFLPNWRTAEFERFNLREGDIVLSLDRPFIVTGTKVARVRAFDLPCLLLQRVGRFEIDPERLHSDYLFLWVQSPHFANQIDPGRSNGVPHVSSREVEASEIRVPSLAEQQRIVAKVDGLIALCDQLEQRIGTAQAESQRLLEAVLHEALNGVETVV